LLATHAPLAIVHLLRSAKDIWLPLRSGRRAALAAVVSDGDRWRHPRLGHLPPRHRVLEGVNDRIEVIKRMAYGFRDPACFFLKIKAAFPGRCDEPFSLPAKRPSAAPRQQDSSSDSH